MATIDYSKRSVSLNNLGAVRSVHPIAPDFSGQMEAARSKGAYHGAGARLGGIIAGTGAVIGKDFRYIDIAQGDNSGFCTCKNCTKLYKQDGKAYVSIKDHGETIPPDDLPFIFDRFHKSDRSRSLDKNGMGLGLYIVKPII